MQTLRTLVSALWTDESGQDTTEYVLLVVLIALAAALGMGVLATAVNGGFSAAGGAVESSVADFSGGS